MQKIKSFLLVLSTALLFLSIWALFFFAQNLNERVDNELSNYIPENAIVSLRVDTRFFIKNGLEDFIAHGEQGSFEEIQRLLEKQEKTDLNLGIDFSNEMVFYFVEINDQKHACLLVHIADHEDFKKAENYWKKKNCASTSGENIGLIVLANDKSELTAEQLSIQAGKLLSGKKSKKLKSTGSAMELTIHTGIEHHKPIFKPAVLQVDIEANKLLLNGDVSIDIVERERLKYRLKKEGLHLSIPVTSSDVSDSIESYLSVFGIQEYDIAGISMNYRGLTIEEIPGLKLQPDFDLLIAFEQKIDLDSVRSVILKQNDMFKANNGGFSYGKVHYKLHQVDQHTIYIGRSDFAKSMLEQQDPSVIFDLNGNPKHLTELQGNGMMRKLAELVSLFAASKKLSNSIEDLSLLVKQVKNSKKYELTGQIEFKNDKSAQLALIEFLLESKLLN